VARIPRAAQLGLDPSAAQNTRGVVDIPIPDFSGQRAAAEALDGVGKAMLEFGNKLQEAETDRKIVTATNATRSELDKAKRSILEDPNVKPEDYEKVYQERSDAIFKNYGATIPGGKAKAVWDNFTGDLGFSGLTEMRGATRQKQLENATAETIATVAEAVKGFADLDQSEEVFTSNFTATHEYISGQVKSGLMAPDRGAQALAELETGFRKAYTERTLYAIDGMRQAKNYAGATEALYAAKKDGKIDDKSFTATRAVLLNEQNGFEAQGDADKYWEQGKGYQGALALARKEPDIAKRQEIEKNITQRFQQEKVAEDARQDDLQKAVWAHVSGGGTIGNAKVSLIKDIDPNRLGSIRAFENARDAEAGMTGPKKAEWTAASKNWKDELQSVAAMPGSVFIQDPSTWSPRDYAKFQVLTPDDQNAIRAAQRDMREKGSSYSELSKVEGQLLDMAKIVASKDWALNSDARSRPDKTDKLIGALRGQAQGLLKDNPGRPLTIDQVQRGVALALKQAGETSDFVNWQTFSMNADPDFAANRFDTMEYETAFADLKTAGGGTDPSFEEVQALLAKRRKAAQ